VQVVGVGEAERRWELEAGGQAETQGLAVAVAVAAPKQGSTWAGGAGLAAAA
jgi:hypothetical protein